MVAKQITHIGVHLGPDAGSNDAIVGVRVVPDGRIGTTVYGRTLNAGETDSGEGITLNNGDTLVVPAGSANIRLNDVDKYAEEGPDGFAPVANTVWTWLQVPPHADEAFFRYFFATARRLDIAHSLYISALHALAVGGDEPFIKARTRIFHALGNAESMLIALSRAFEMIGTPPSQFSVATAVPHEIGTLQPAVKAIRDAFEHIDERALGKARREDASAALSIFDQTDLLSDGILRYANHSVNLKTEVVPALLAARKFIYDVMAEAGNTKTINREISIGPVTGDK